MKLKLMTMGILMAAISGPVLAQDVFLSCDGYRTPGRRWDGMTGQANLFGGNRGDPDRVVPDFGAQGIDSCTRALADPRLLSTQTLRRASLLQARGLHRLTTNDTAGALADLDLAEAAIGNDPFGRRSVGLATRLLRAYVRHWAGQSQAAAEGAAALLDARPWDPNFTEAAIQLHLAASGDWTAYATHLRSLSRTNPRLIALLFVLAATRGAFDEAVPLYPQIVLDVPHARGGYVIQGLSIARLQAIVRQLTLQGVYAYALAATGDRERAANELADARRTLTQLLAPPLPPEGRNEPTRDQIREHDTLVALARPLGPEFDRWEHLIRLRNQVADGNVQAVLADLMASRIGADGALLDLLRAMARTSEPMRAQLAPVIAAAERRIANDLDRNRQIGLRHLLDMLPEPETEERTPAFAPGSSSILWGEHEGFQSHRSHIEGAQTLSYASGRGSLSTASELVLLRAAQLARESGQHGFIVVDRQAVRRTVVTMMWGSPINERSNGQDAEIDVLFVDPVHLPALYAGAPWRVIDPDTVWASLSPIYVRDRPQPQR